MPDYPHVEKLDSVTVILPVMNETTSLDQTVRIILRDARDTLRELLIVVCRQTTPQAMTVVERLQRELGDLIVVHRQQLPFLGGAMRFAFPFQPKLKGSYRAQASFFNLLGGSKTTSAWVAFKAK